MMSGVVDGGSVWPVN